VREIEGRKHNKKENIHKEKKMEKLNYFAENTRTEKIEQ